jgi:ribosomal protein S27AE
MEEQNKEQAVNKKCPICEMGVMVLMKDDCGGYWYCNACGYEEDK